VSESYLEPISTYTMKLRLYPTKAQAELIDKAIRALHLAFNMTFHEVFQKNPEVCTQPNAEGAVWPDFKKMTGKEWRHRLIEMNPLIAEAPAPAIMQNGGIFMKEGRDAWPGNGLGSKKKFFPVDIVRREDFHFYSQNKPRRNFTVQVDAKKIVPSASNPKVCTIEFPLSDIYPGGKKRPNTTVKARGFSRKLRFGENGEHNFEEALSNGELKNAYTVKFSKDNCGDYYASITFSCGKTARQSLFRELKVESDIQDVGIDVGIKDVAILSAGDKVENKHFKQARDHTLRKLNRQLSRRMGPANMAYRDYNKAIRAENRALPEGEEPKPLMTPSKRYLETQRRKARLERRIARQRESYYHEQTERIVSHASTIAVETLMVKNMLRNHKLAFALGDAAMSEFVAMLKYKAERRHIPILTIGTFESSSQLCSVCGFLNPAVKNLDIREWCCPQCGTTHDRDINAAKNILAIAQRKGSKEDIEENIKGPPKRKPAERKPKDTIILEDRQELVVRFSRELSKFNAPRYVIINKTDGTVIDDGQGAGYRSISNAKNCFKAKMNWSAKNKA